MYFVVLRVEKCRRFFFNSGEFFFLFHVQTGQKKKFQLKSENDVRFFPSLILVEIFWGINFLLLETGPWRSRVQRLYVG